jgi:hypothetical protein
LADGFLIQADQPLTSVQIGTGALTMVNGGFAIGIAVGAAIGVATGNFGMGLALGVALGFAFGAAARRKLKSED